MRDAFANDLTDIGAENDKVVLLSGDIGNRMFDRFKGRHRAVSSTAASPRPT